MQIPSLAARVGHSDNGYEMLSESVLLVADPGFPRGDQPLMGRQQLHPQRGIFLQDQPIKSSI